MATENLTDLFVFYHHLSDYDAFNTTKGWYANSYLAIDQGPIVVMIENYRTGLLWNLFMSSPEVAPAKVKLNFN